MVHDSTQDPLVLQLLEEVNKLKAEHQAKIPNWNQPRPDPLTRRILNTLYESMPVVSAMSILTAEVDDKTALKAFTAGLRDCFFKYMINANTWKTYSEVIAQVYNHASAEVRTYQGKPPTTIPYQQVGSGSQIQPNEKTSTFQRAVVPPFALLNISPSQ